MNKGSRLGECASWWFECQCRCRTTHMRVKTLVKEWHPDRLALDIAQRLRCRKCGERPGVELVDDPQRDAPGYVHYGPAAVRVRLTDNLTRAS